MMPASVSLFLILAVVSLTGCVAPEETPAPRPKPVAAAPTPPRSMVGFDDAPLPNRRIATPPSDSIIRSK